jgi:hypothetical protein
MLFEWLENLESKVKHFNSKIALSLEYVKNHIINWTPTSLWTENIWFETSRLSLFDLLLKILFSSITFIAWMEGGFYFFKLKKIGS